MIIAAMMKVMNYLQLFQDFLTWIELTEKFGDWVSYGHNYAMALSTFIEILLISKHWVAIFQFFPAYLFEIDQAHIKNLK